MFRNIWQVEVRVDDLERSIRFFSSVFDWQITAVSADYAMIDTGRAPVACLWAVGDSGMPLGVCHYVKSVDCEADAARAVALGGKVAVERSEVPEVGAWTDSLDPWRNELAFWQAFTPGEPEFTGSGRNPLAWIELGAADYAAAERYYGSLVGWTFSAVDGMTDYGVCTAIKPGVGLVGGERGGKLRGMTDYITVADIHAACAAVVKAGGQLLGEPQTLGDGGLFALFLDPDENRFGLVQPG